MNRDITLNTLPEQFATALVAQMDPASNSMTYVVAGHTAPMRIKGGMGGGLHRPELLPGKGFMLGIDEYLPFTSQTAPYEAGDRFVFYTDGLVEVERVDRTYLSEEGLVRFSSELPEDPDAAAGQLVRQAEEYNAPNTFGDDVTLVVLDRIS
jgi:sigma-B regulation protein RsbU (phosphoserine phosphatase)